LTHINIMTPEIYLDGNATSPVLPAAINAAVHAMQTCYGNPSSTHTTGLQARALLDNARLRAQRVIGAGAGRVLFNSGATEGIQTAVLSALCALRARRDAGETIGALLVYGATEHKAVPQSLAHWNTVLELNLELAALPVDGDGLHDLDALRRLAPQAAMVCTMAANNETGVVSDIAGIEAVLRETGCGAYWMVDCVQALGKCRLQLEKSRIDYAPFSGHKLYAPKGIGMLYVRDGAPFTPLIVGGGQEGALRSGTENMSGIAALDAVLAALEQGDVFRTHDQLCDFRERLAASLRRALPGIVFNAPFEHALPTTLNFSVPGLSSRELMDVFDAAGVRVSSGSACSSSKAAPSYVLEAMGVPLWRSGSAIRMSFGPLTDDATITEACQRIAHCGAVLAARGDDDTLPRSVPDEDMLVYSRLLATDPEPGQTLDAGMHLDAAALRGFLAAHPEALLVDVRESWEHAASGIRGPGGSAVLNVPLGRLADHIGGWLQSGVPLVFCCRSGARSARAATCLRRLGHVHAYDLAGGMALAREI
jgi:cysteine sulfinate desulfinase/cysteine desulfurase-like protein/rhodanese-related sulfurtransferase